MVLKVSRVNIDQLANHELVMLVVYLLGGESQRVDTEDIAKKAEQIAPGRFVWRKYPDQINIEIIRAFLSDAKKPKNGKYLTGSGKSGWMLTEHGLEVARENAIKLRHVGRRDQRLTPQQKRWLKHEQARLLRSEAYAKFRSGNLDQIGQQEAEAFFRIDDYVKGEARERAVLRLKNAFSEDKDLKVLIQVLADKVRGAGK